MKCQYCGCEAAEDARVCPECGKPLGRRMKKPDVGAVKAKVGSFAGALNSMVEEARQDIRLKDMYAEIFRRHSIRESEELFICGTEHTTPSERSMIAEWPRPWLHSRVFAVLLVMTLLLLALIRVLHSLYAVPSLLFVGGLLIPFSLMIFFWECNIPRNISFIQCLVMFLLGGVGVMILSEMLTKVLLPDQSKWPVLFGFLAALGDILPMAAVIVLFTRMEPMKFILNGVCLGSCVSGGFAMLIFVGYLFTLDLDFSSGTVYLDIVFVRHFINNILMSVCLLNCGALIGGGLRDASDDPAFRFTALKDLRFLRWAGTAYVLLVVYYVNNTMWNSVILRLIVIAVSAAAVLIQIAAGQRQCVRVCHSAWDREAAEDEETEEEE